jgi:uncharacterized protein GlcG (DUF336 family)
MQRTRFTLLMASLIGLALASTSAVAQELINQKTLSLDVALAIAHGALDQCRADGFHVSVTIVDGAGLVKVQMHDDGAGPHTVDFSRKKAYSAFTFKRTSGETGKAWAAAPPAPNIQDAVGTAGGVPIRAGDAVIGAIGVSGAPGGDKDEACSNAGIAKVASKLK